MPRVERKRKQRQNKLYEAAKGSGSLTGWIKKITDGEQVRATPQQQHCAPSENNSMASDQTSTENPAASSANQNLAGQVKTELDDKETTLGQKDCHSFYYRIDKKLKEHSVTCTKRGTVLEALQTDQPFRTFLERNREKGKSIIIERDNRFLATHFPCWLFKDEETVLIKSFPGEAAEVSHGYEIKDGDIITFYINSIGGLNMRKMSFLRNPKLQKRKALCIYAYIGETVEDALKRDGRFIDEVFQGSIYLRKEGEEKEYDLSTVISRVFKERSLELQKTGQRQAENKTANDKTNPDSGRKSDPSSNAGNPSTSSAPGGSKPSSDKAMADKGPNLYKKVHEIPDSTEILKILREQFQGLVEQMKERHKKTKVKDVVELLREEFGKNIQSFSKVGTVKKLMNMSASVCYIEVENEISGTGFLLFDRYILTNAHIIKAFTHNRVLKRKVTATFAYESSSSKNNNEWPIKKEVVAGMYSYDEFKHWMDFALLELDQQEKDDEMLPPALLSAYEPLPEEGGICLIGHPEGEEKKMDPTFIVPSKERSNALDAHFGAGGSHLQYNPQSQDFTYQTCFYHGSSGSPILGTTCQLVAMHTGSYCWKKINGKKCYVLEFGISMSSILVNLLLQMMKNRQIELLSKLIAETMKSESTIQVVAEFICHMLKGWKEDLESVLLTVITTAKECDGSSELRTSLCKIIPRDDLKTLINSHRSSKSLHELSEFLKEKETPMETDQQTAGN
ncbi:serine protease FAM111A-like isoform X2 [Paramormyrops kingsleyae]